MKLRTNDVTWRDIDGELVILDTSTSTYLTTNATGALLVRHLVEGRTDQDLITTLVDAYDIDRDTAARDVAAFVAMLRQLGLLVEPSDSTS